MFDFYKEFLGVDIAKVEQISDLVARITAVFYKGLIAQGLDDEQAQRVISTLVKSISCAVFESAPKT